MGQRSRRPEPPPSSNPAAELAALRARYQQEMPLKIRAVKEAAQALGPGDDRERLEALHILAHRLVGSAAIYGFAEVSRAAAALEELVVQALDAPGEPSRSWSGRLETLIAGIERAASEGH